MEKILQLPRESQNDLIKDLEMFKNLDNEKFKLAVEKFKNFQMMKILKPNF